MNLKTPKPLNQHITNFVALLGAFSLGSGFFIMPLIDTEAKGELVSLAMTLIVCFLSYKFSDLIVEKIKSKNLSNLYKNALIWSLPVLYLFIYAALDIRFSAEKYKPEIEIQEHSVIVQGDISEE